MEPGSWLILTGENASIAVRAAPEEVVAYLSSNPHERVFARFDGDGGYESRFINADHVVEILPGDMASHRGVFRLPPA